MNILNCVVDTLRLSSGDIIDTFLLQNHVPMPHDPPRAEERFNPPPSANASVPNLCGERSS